MTFGLIFSEILNTLLYMQSHWLAHYDHSNQSDKFNQITLPIHTYSTTPSNYFVSTFNFSDFQTNILLDILINIFPE